ncbi:MAG TPA: hypothetical protein VF553_03330 [Pyrinomonadaceae bacterium]|jgi:hypothetical protein
MKSALTVSDTITEEHAPRHLAPLDSMTRAKGEVIAAAGNTSPPPST